ncbi:MAG: hypothetical protein ACRDPT_16460 [Streptomycetales bacterium]
MSRLLRCPTCRGSGATPGGRLDTRRCRARFTVTNICASCAGEGRINA